MTTSTKFYIETKEGIFLNDGWTNTIRSIDDVIRHLNNYKESLLGYLCKGSGNPNKDIKYVPISQIRLVIVINTKEYDEVTVRPIKGKWQICE